MSVKRMKWIGESELLWSSISGSMSYNFLGFGFMSDERIKWIGEIELLWSSISCSMSYN
jgi:hypothetical protein